DSWPVDRRVCLAGEAVTRLPIQLASRAPPLCPIHAHTHSSLTQCFPTQALPWCLGFCPWRFLFVPKRCVCVRLLSNPSSPALWPFPL
ncbi:hypothetical protein CCMA1212_005540, partial [Trichoderma ghanense]